MSYPPPPPAMSSSVPPLRGKGMLVTGTVFLVLGLVAIVLGIIMTARALASLSDDIGTAQAAPTTVTRTFDGGKTYAVYAADGVTVPVGDIEVTGDAGPVTVSATTVDGNVGVSGTNYSEVATFTPAETGSYDVTVSTDGATIAVAPSLTSAAKSLIWLIAVVAGGLMAFLGVIFLIIGAVQRSGSKKRQRAAMGGQPY
ncbi:MAG: hypothetical protein KDB63_04855 [Nocardioidaceae bacterium]|nr:hypothetical protein [Nocardioidaceae bacterium]